MKYATSTTSLTSIISTTTCSESSFEKLIAKLFSCNIVLVLTDHAKQYIQNCYGSVTLATILNQFATITDLHLTIRDLIGHNAYGLSKLRFRFFDADQFKNRPNGGQLKRLHFDVISSMSNSCWVNNEDEEFKSETPWYDLWKNIFIDTFEPSDHDFIGSNCGCFFVITKHELPHYKVIFERLCSSVKQNSSLRFIQSDFLRYFIVLSDQLIDPSASNTDEFGSICVKLKSEFPNSFVLYINEALTHLESLDSAEKNEDLSSLTNELDGLKLNVDSSTDSPPIDPLSAANYEANKNSKFYNELVSQRQVNQSSNVNTTTQSLDIINEWLANILSPEQVKSIEEALSDSVNLMLREFIAKSLVPWAERQIKTLSELIAQRKGFRKSIFSATRSLFSNVSSSTASLTKNLTGTTLAGGAPSGVIYIPDAQEMQQRKLGDICMIFGIYEMAHNLYYSARKDFQSESAWLYYAGASEMSAISSYFLGKYQHNHLDQAIMAYMDTCKSASLATRAAILATELLCQLKRYNEAAILYIRMTGDDSDLRSALFLEQASKCFLTISPQIPFKSSSSQAILSALLKSSNIETVGTFGARYRKAAYHYILAGHRYNRCGLKHFALACYRRFNYPNWEHASDHINMTVAKLFISIGSGNNSKYTDYKQKGLEIYRNFSHKEGFFKEFLYELKKQPEPRQGLFLLNIPFVARHEFISLDSVQLSSGKNPVHSCMIGEPVRILFELTSPFAVQLTNVRLICGPVDRVTISNEPNQIALQPNEPVNVLLTFTALAQTEFSLSGIEYTIEGQHFRKLFPAKMQDSLKFKSITSLPLVSFEIRIQELDFKLSSYIGANPQQPLDRVAIPSQVFGTEIFTLSLSFALNGGASQFSHMRLFTNSKSSNEELSSSALTCYDLNTANPAINLQMQIPASQPQHVVLFKLVYNDSGNLHSRTISRTLHFDVFPCFQIDLRIDNVITMRNLCAHNLSIFDVDTGESADHSNQYVTIPSSHCAHLLLLKSHFRWTIQTGQSVRSGKLEAF